MLERRYRSQGSALGCPEIHRQLAQAPRDLTYGTHALDAWGSQVAEAGELGLKQ